MVYQLPQTYHFACPQVKHIGSLSERSLKTAGTHIISNLESTPKTVLVLEAHYTVS